MEIFEIIWNEPAYIAIAALLLAAILLTLLKPTIKTVLFLVLIIGASLAYVYIGTGDIDGAIEQVSRKAEEIGEEVTEHTRELGTYIKEKTENVLESD